ncbi:chemotaxis protein CheW [Christensenellaceae bacterium OttesenSCG-928-M15]|nr:chemotaxis protein CheW [Christensenellaceae bacterium OttesenSCG-928-M15]
MEEKALAPVPESAMEAASAVEASNILDATEGKYLTVYLNDHLYGIPVRDVVQIVGVEEIVPVPEFPYYAKGIMNLRGNIIPIIDLRLRLGMPETGYTDRTCIIITSVREQEVGFVVDSVDEVTDIDNSEILSTPPSGDFKQKYVNGVCKHGSKLVLRLAVNNILNDGEIGSLYEYS